MAILLSYILLKNVEIFNAYQVYKTEDQQSIEPLFSYTELKEKAQMADTIDHYYMDLSKLVDETEMIETNQIEKETPVDIDGDVEIDPTLRNQYDETAVAIDREKEMAFIESDPSEWALFEQEEQEKEEIHHLLFEDRQTDVSSFEPQSPEILSDQIDYEKRNIASSWEIDDKPMKVLDLSDDEVDLVEVRKKLFANLEEEISTEPTFELSKFEEQKTEVDFQPFSSPELEDQLDDLEEFYLKMKANEPKKEEEK